MAYRFKTWAETSAGQYFFLADAIEDMAGYPATTDVKSPVTYGSRGEKTGLYVGGDLGSATWPSASNVWYGTAKFGPTGADYTPSKRASSITNCTAGNVRNGVLIDDVPGTYTGELVAPGTGIDLADDSSVFFQDLDAETVTYIPATGSTRSITALVDRGSPSPVPPTGAYSGPPFTITVRNNATTGISSTELDIGKDNIAVALRRGLTLQSRPIGKLLQVDPGLIVLEVR